MVVYVSKFFVSFTTAFVVCFGLMAFMVEYSNFAKFENIVAHATLELASIAAENGGVPDVQKQLLTDDLNRILAEYDNDYDPAALRVTAPAMNTVQLREPGTVGIYAEYHYNDLYELFHMGDPISELDTSMPFRSRKYVKDLPIDLTVY